MTAQCTTGTIIIKSGPLSWVIGWIYRRLAEVQDKIMVWVKLISLWSWYSTKKLWSQKNKSCAFWSFKWQDGRMQSERTSIRHTTLCTTQDVAQRKSRGQRGQQRQRETGGSWVGFGVADEWNAPLYFKELLLLVWGIATDPLHAPHIHLYEYINHFQLWGWWCLGRTK